MGGRGCWVLVSVVMVMRRETWLMCLGVAGGYGIGNPLSGRVLVQWLVVCRRCCWCLSAYTPRRERWDRGWNQALISCCCENMRERKGIETGEMRLGLRCANIRIKRVNG